MILQRAAARVSGPRVVEETSFKFSSPQGNSLTMRDERELINWYEK